MTNQREEFYTFRWATPQQVVDLCDLWQGSVVEYSERRGFVRVKSDRISIDLFCLFYELHEYLEHCRPVDPPLRDRLSRE